MATAVDVLAPFINRSSAIMLLAMQGEWMLHHLMLRNDRKCMNIFMFPEINQARQELGQIDYD